MPQNTPKTCLYRYQNRNPIDFTYIDLLPLFPFAIIIKYMKITSKIYTVNLILCYGYFFIVRFQVKNIFENSLNISFSFHKIIFFSEHSLRFWLSCVCVWKKNRDGLQVLLCLTVHSNISSESSGALSNF